MDGVGEALWVTDKGGKRKLRAGRGGGGGFLEAFAQKMQ